MRRMRPHIGAAVFLLGAFSVFGAACGALDQFEHTITDEATIPGMLSEGPFSPTFGMSFSGIDLSKSQSFANAGVGPGDVDAIYVKSVLVEGTHASVDRLDVLFNSITLWVEAPGVPRQTIATKYMFERSNQASLDVSDDGMGMAINLKPYAVAASMSVGSDVNVKTKPAFETTLRTTIVLLVDINLVGL